MNSLHPPSLDQIDAEVLLELYRQACINAREHLELRYKRFAVFVAVTALIGAATFSIADLYPMPLFLMGFGVLMTLLFWLLDYRTQRFYEIKCKRVLACEKLLGVSEVFVPATEEAPPGLPMRVLMHLIFASVLLGWLGLAAFFAVEFY